MAAEDIVYDHIIPDLKEWPINKFSDNRDDFIQKLIDYVLEKIVAGDTSVEDILNKTIYLEQQRVKLRPWKVDPADEKAYWKSLSKEVARTKQSDNKNLEQLKILKRIIHRYSEEIIGYFMPQTHRFARRFLTGFFKRLYNNGWGRGHKGIWGRKSDVVDKIHIRGHIDEIRSLFDKGTVVIVPTHYTNLDSIQIGYAIDAKAGLPAFSYGAGLNLYDYELLAYYMNRLGAYRVDRRKKNPVYLETLKSMASLSLIEGLNHIFFPGGTRSRSGAIEDKLKLGLLNSVIDAQRRCILKGVDRKIFIVPLAVGYHFVLEAAGLINNHLKTAGREKYLSAKRRGGIIRTIWNFLSELRKHDSEVYLSFGKPLDVIGNQVDGEGNSFDKRNKPIDISTYFMSEGVANYDPQRESVYTRLLADRIVESFKCNNVVLSSHVAAYALFKLIESSVPDMDIYDIFKMKASEFKIELRAFKQRIAEIVAMLKALEHEGKAELSEAVADPVQCYEDGIKNVGIYHQPKVINVVDNQYVVTEDLRLLYYYHNKLVHYEVE